MDEGQGIISPKILQTSSGSCVVSSGEWDQCLPAPHAQSLPHYKSLLGNTLCSLEEEDSWVSKVE